MNEEPMSENKTEPLSDPSTSSERRIVFGGNLDSAKDIVFDSDDLPGVDEYQGKLVLKAYLTSFNTAIECARENIGTPEVLSKIHAVALRDVNWKRTIAFLENADFAEGYQYAPGAFRIGLPSRLSFANASRNVVYDTPSSEHAVEMVGVVGEFVSSQIETIPRTDKAYFDLAAASSLMVFLSHPFPGGNKKTVRPFITYILTRGGLTGKWLEKDSGFIQGFKRAWTGLVEKFQKETGLEEAKNDPDYDQKWLEYWRDKVESGEILDDENVKSLAVIIKKAPYYTHALGQKVASPDS